MEQLRSLELKRGKYEYQIREERANFFFLEDGAMVIPDVEFDSYLDAMVDAIVNHGEDIDDMISLVFPEKVDHAPVKKILTGIITAMMQ